MQALRGHTRRLLAPACARRALSTRARASGPGPAVVAAAAAGFGAGALAIGCNLAAPRVGCEAPEEHGFAEVFGEARRAPTRREFGPNFIADACEHAIPALVNISSVQHGPWGQVAQSAGSGFVIRSDGLIATNAHVVKSATSLDVTLSDGRRYKGKVLSMDTMSDLALVMVDEPLEAPLPVMEIGDSSLLRPGEFVIALGSPLNMQNSVTAGIVSSVARAASELGVPQSRTDYIQTDAAINVGNSGGPLINLDGKVVGINTMKVAGGDGISFAIPINTAWLVLKQLRDTGKVVRPFLGLKMASLNPNLARYERRRMRSFPNVKRGVIVMGVAPNSPAQRAGVEVGDVITHFAGKEVSDVGDLVRAIGYDLGKTYDVRLVRKGNVTKEVQLTSEGLRFQ